jgi:hypothetical protein
MEKTVTVRWPFKQDDNGGFDSISEAEFVDAIKFSIKNVLLTNPGEKISDPLFGIGLRKYLFSLSTEDFSSLSSPWRRMVLDSGSASINCCMMFAGLSAFADSSDTSSS